MRRSFLLALVAVVLVACGAIGGEAVGTSSTSPGSTTAPASTDPTPASPTTTDETAFTTTGCVEPPDEFEALCEAVELIRENYVDPIELSALADAAEMGVEEMDGSGVHTGPLTCAIPSDEFVEVCQAIDEHDLPPGQAVEAAIAGMARYALDPNSVYFDPQSLALIEEEQTGEVEGIGALVTSEDTTAEDPSTTTCPIISDTCRLVVVSPLDGSPAEAAGLQPDDVIVTVDGQDIEGWTVDEVTAEVRGPAGSPVELGILRGNERLEIEITRAAVEIPVVEAELVDDTAYVRLNVFTGNADEQFRDALADLLEAGAQRVVLDMRNNPGGSLDTAVSVASEFLDQGLVLRTQAPDEEITYEVHPGGVAADAGLPVLVLVNEGSASASEVVAAVLQETGRATILGQPTFGKNTVQSRYTLPNGGALKLTIARWVTPEGFDFGETGVVPDIEAEYSIELSPEELVARTLELTAA